MTLYFPNQSRSFDKARDCVRFVGHDDVFEVVFFLKTDAIIKIDGQVERTEPGYCSVFDAARDAIERVALRSYLLRKNPMITLTADDIH